MNKLDKITSLQLNLRAIRKSEHYQVIKDIDKKLEILFIYHTNALENSSLSLPSTQKILSGSTIGGKTIKEHLEVIALQEALVVIKQMAKDNEKFSVPMLLEIYYTVLLRYNMKTIWLNAYNLKSKQRINNEFRDVAEVSVGMNDIMNWYRNTVTFWTNNVHPVEIAVTLFIKLLKIKPFNYENERIAKLILNLELLRTCLESF